MRWILVFQNIERELLFSLILALLLLFFLSHRLFAARYKREKKILSNILESTSNGVIICKRDDMLSIVYANDNFLNLIGYSRQEISSVLDNKLINLIYNDDIGDTLKSLYGQLSQGDQFEIKLRLCRKDDSKIWVLWKGAKNLYSGKDCFYCTFINITESVLSQAEQRIDSERCQILMDSSENVIFEYNIRDRICYFSSKYKAKFGEEPVTENLPRNVIEKRIIYSEDIPKFLSLFSCVSEGKKGGSQELRIRNADGEYIWCNIKYTVIEDSEGKPFKVVGKIIDIDKQKKETESLKIASQMDSFTNLYNKSAVLAVIEKYLLDHSDKKKHALFFIDIDNFKTINDTFGHLYGDKIILELSKLLKKQFRYTDILGRVGGDEFLVLLKDYLDEKYILEKASTLCKCISEINVGSDVFEITSSIGIAFYPKDGRTVSQLLEKADIALYAAKKEGKNSYRAYSPQLKAKYRENLHLLVVENENRMNVQDYTGFLLEISDELYNSCDIDRSLNIILEKISKRYCSQRAYVFEIKRGGLIENTCEHCSGMKSRLGSVLHGFDAALYEKNFGENGIYYNCLGPDYKGEGEYLKIFGVENAVAFLQAKLTDCGLFKGFIGYDLAGQRKFSREEVEAISFAAKTLSALLSSKRLKLINKYTDDKKTDIMENVNLPVIVVEQDRMVYKNPVALEKLRGETLKECLCAEKVCSQDCLKLKEGESFSCDLELLGGKVKATSVRMAWQGGRPATLFYIK
jgi:diguanylate cyclase (GGDEF)-like protein/PAS domain S-box-containing protein